ncbi:hypothetical protein [Erwinia typographi]|uniref:hypothetical protein n=1 Tax=Erwinia typographi TaxID=371042 RepID=UPI000AF5284C|nr:hypothetical protein [Erwinia typographi]
MNKKTKLIAILLSLLFCGLNISTSGAEEESAKLTGFNVADDMKKRFYDTSDTCGDDPAWFCNGILIRAANASPNYHAWEPSPSSAIRGGIPFSYFRNDLNTTRLQASRSQGFTLKSGRYGTSSPWPIKVLCSFPYDAGTNIRTHQGCGAASDYPEESRECESQGITTAEQWLDHFNSVDPVSPKRYHHQCSFDASTDAFATSLKARRLTNVQDQMEAWSQNELSIATWPAGIGEQLPIESFFYIDGLHNDGLTGLEAAKYMQSDYFKQTGIRIPVIKITLPEKESENVDFTFVESDQGPFDDNYLKVIDILSIILLG